MTYSSRDCSAAARFGVRPLRCWLIDSHLDSDSGRFSARSSTLLRVHTSIRPSHLVHRLCSSLLNRTANIQSCSVSNSGSGTVATLQLPVPPGSHSSLPAEDRIDYAAVLSLSSTPGSSLLGWEGVRLLLNPGFVSGPRRSNRHGCWGTSDGLISAGPPQPPAAVSAVTLEGVPWSLLTYEQFHTALGHSSEDQTVKNCAITAAVRFANLSSTTDAIPARPAPPGDRRNHRVKDIHHVLHRSYSHGYPQAVRDYSHPRTDAPRTVWEPCGDAQLTGRLRCIDPAA